MAQRTWITEDELVDRLLLIRKGSLLRSDVLDILITLTDEVARVKTVDEAKRLVAQQMAKVGHRMMQDTEEDAKLLEKLSKLIDSPPALRGNEDEKLH